MPRTTSDQPTDGELEILTYLWDHGPAELGAIHAALSTHRKVALTTVATMLNVMLGKSLVARNKDGRHYTWTAKLGRQKAARGMVGKLIDRVFEGSAHSLVAHLLDNQKLSDSEREKILKLLEQSKNSAAGAE